MYKEPATVIELNNDRDWQTLQKKLTIARKVVTELDLNSLAYYLVSLSLNCCMIVSVIFE